MESELKDSNDPNSPSSEAAVTLANATGEVTMAQDLPKSSGGSPDKQPESSAVKSSGSSHSQPSATRQPAESPEPAISLGDLERRIGDLERRLGTAEASGATRLQVSDTVAWAEARMEEEILGAKAAFMRAVQTQAAELREHAKEAEARVLATVDRKIEEMVQEVRDLSQQQEKKVLIVEQELEKTSTWMEKTSAWVRGVERGAEEASALAQRAVQEAASASTAGTVVDVEKVEKQLRRHLEQELAATVSRLMALEERCDRTFLTRDATVEAANKLLVSEFCRRNEIEPLKKEFEQERSRLDHVIREQRSNLVKLQQDQEKHVEIVQAIKQEQAQNQGLQMRTPAPVDTLELETFFKRLREEFLTGASPKALHGAASLAVVGHSAPRYLEQLEQAFSASRPPSSHGTDKERHRDLHEMVRDISVRLPKL